MINLPVIQKISLKASESGHQVQVGALLGPTVNYLGCSKLCNPAMVARLANVLKEMDKDGSTKAILKTYGEIE